MEIKIQQNTQLHSKEKKSQLKMNFREFSEQNDKTFPISIKSSQIIDAGSPIMRQKEESNFQSYSESYGKNNSEVHSTKTTSHQPIEIKSRFPPIDNRERMIKFKQNNSHNEQSSNNPNGSTIIYPDIHQPYSTDIVNNHQTLENAKLNTNDVSSTIHLPRIQTPDSQTQTQMKPKQQIARKQQKIVSSQRDQSEKNSEQIELLAAVNLMIPNVKPITLQNRNQVTLTHNPTNGPSPAPQLNTNPLQKFTHIKSGTTNQNINYNNISSDKIKTIPDNANKLDEFNEYYQIQATNPAQHHPASNNLASVLNTVASNPINNNMNNYNNISINSINNNQINQEPSRNHSLQRIVYNGKNSVNHQSKDILPKQSAKVHSSANNNNNFSHNQAIPQKDPQRRSFDGSLEVKSQSQNEAVVVVPTTNISSMPIFDQIDSIYMRSVSYIHSNQENIEKELIKMYNLDSIKSGQAVDILKSMNMLNNTNIGSQKNSKKINGHDFSNNYDQTKKNKGSIKPTIDHNLSQQEQQKRKNNFMRKFEISGNARNMSYQTQEVQNEHLNQSHLSDTDQYQQRQVFKIDNDCQIKFTLPRPSTALKEIQEDSVDIINESIKQEMGDKTDGWNRLSLTDKKEIVNQQSNFITELEQINQLGSKNELAIHDYVKIRKNLIEIDTKEKIKQMHLIQKYQTSSSNSNPLQIENTQTIQTQES